MSKAQNASKKLSENKSFSWAEISKMQEEALIEENGQIFSKPIEAVLVSPNPLPKRLNNPGDSLLLPYPFVFSPARKYCFQKLLPYPQNKPIVIEGFSQAGKSNFACHLSLIYRMKPQIHAVIYIGNIRKFNQDPFTFIVEEIFYWFLDEISESPMVQTLLEHMVLGLDTENRRYVWTQFILQHLTQLCRQKGKKIIFLIDQFNNHSLAWSHY